MDYHAPFHIASRESADKATIVELTRGKAGCQPNTFESLHVAGGVCADIGKHLKDTHPYIYDDFAQIVEDAEWRAPLMAHRCPPWRPRP